MTENMGEKGIRSYYECSIWVIISVQLQSCNYRQMSSKCKGEKHYFV